MNTQDNLSILRLDQVSLQGSLGSDLLLQNISFKIQPGEKIGIIGASGAGKTSLLRLLNNLVSPSAGTIYWHNNSTQQLKSVQLRRKIVLVNQEPKLLGMKVIDALSYPLQLQKLGESEIQRRIDALTNLLQIPREWSVKTELQLSLGQRQLVAITRALLLEPELLLLDEPTSALDLGIAGHVIRVLESLNQSQNITILMVNHQLELIKGFCDRFLFLNQGRLEEDIPATESNWEKLRQKILQQHTDHELDNWL
ncbi:MAG: ATP-binding cassette domain-containing protein [Cyanobacteria bacterium J06621_8]